MRSYFAYGSNMIVAAMRERCPGARFLDVARLSNHRFRIVRSGYASLVWEQGAEAYGILWAVGPRDERALDDYEEIAAGLYRRSFLRVERIDDGKWETALVYLAVDKNPGRPRRGYIVPILDAAHAHGLPAEALADIAAAG
jgi:hypothetical protein